MFRSILAIALCAAPLASLAAQAKPLSLEQRMLLRCSAAFAMVSHGQENGNADALQYPDMAERGKEFFVRATARVMNEAELSREEVSAALSAEAKDIASNKTLAEVMPACLSLLPAQ